MRLSSLIFLFLAYSSLTASPEEQAYIPFQVYLWPGTPNPNLEIKKKSEKKKQTVDSPMVEYVSPTIQFSPDGNTKSQNVIAAERRLSPTYRYYGSNPLIFFREVTQENGQTMRLFLGATTIPPNIERALLLFLPSPSNPNQYKIYPIENSQSTVKPGEACVHNISNSTIACLFNNKQIFLKPGQNEIIPLDVENHINMVVRIASDNNSSKWKERYADLIAVNADDSLTVLIYNKSGKENEFRIMKIENTKI